MTITDQNYGFVLKKARKDKFITQMELANLSGVSKSYISRIENRKVYPTVNTYFNLLYSLGYRIKIGDEEI